MSASETLRQVVSGTRRAGVEDPKRLLLLQARETISRRVGRVESSSGDTIQPPTVDPNPLEHLAPYVQAAALKYTSVLPEFLHHLQSSNGTLPLAALPEMLTWAVSQNYDVRPVLGATGTWLAGQNSAWWQFSPEHETPARLIAAYGNETPANRKKHFRRLCVACLDAAHRHLAQVWSVEPADMRGALLQLAIESGPPYPEETVSLALADRTASIRQITQLALAQDEHHRFAQLIRQLAPTLIAENGEVKRSDPMDERWEELAIQAQSTGPNDVARAVISLCPPDLLGDHLELLAKCSPAIASGIRRSASVFRHPALLKHFAQEALKKGGSFMEWEQLPVKDVEELIRWAWDHLPPAKRFGPLVGVLEGSEIFSTEFSRWAIVEVRKSMGWHGPETAFWNQNSVALACRISPEAIPNALEMLNSSQADPRHPLLKSWFPLLTLRHHLLSPFVLRP